MISWHMVWTISRADTKSHLLEISGFSVSWTRFIPVPAQPQPSRETVDIASHLYVVFLRPPHQCDPLIVGFNDISIIIVITTNIVFLLPISMSL